MIAGIKALKRYLREQNVSANAFAQKHHMDRSELAKLLRGERQRVSVGQASSIQKATRGAVNWRLWIPEGE